MSADARSIVPDPGVVIYSFTGAMSASGAGAPYPGTDHNCNQQGCKGLDPVDLGTGLLVLEKTDLSLAGVMPIVLTRTYRQGDNMSRGFGVGANHNYNVFLTSDVGIYTYFDLTLADGGRIHYARTTTATGWDPSAIWEHAGTKPSFTSRASLGMAMALTSR